MSKADLSKFKRTKQAFAEGSLFANAKKDPGGYGMAALTGAVPDDMGLATGIHGYLTNAPGQNPGYGWGQAGGSMLGSLGGSIVGGALGSERAGQMIGGGLGAAWGRSKVDNKLNAQKKKEPSDGKKDGRDGRDADGDGKKKEAGVSAALATYGVKEAYLGANGLADLMGMFDSDLRKYINVAPVVNKGQDLYNQFQRATAPTGPDGHHMLPEAPPHSEHTSLPAGILPGLAAAATAPEGESRLLHGALAGGGSALGQHAGGALGGALGGATGAGLGLLGLILTKQLHMPDGATTALAPRSLMGHVTPPFVHDVPGMLGQFGKGFGQSVGRSMGGGYGARKGQQAASAASKFMNKDGPKKPESDGKKDGRDGRDADGDGKKKEGVKPTAKFENKDGPKKEKPKASEKPAAGDKKKE